MQLEPVALRTQSLFPADLWEGELRHTRGGTRLLHEAQIEAELRAAKTRSEAVRWPAGTISDSPSAGWSRRGYPVGVRRSASEPRFFGVLTLSRDHAAPLGVLGQRHPWTTGRACPRTCRRDNLLRLLSHLILLIFHKVLLVKIFQCTLHIVPAYWAGLAANEARQSTDDSPTRAPLAALAECLMTKPPQREPLLQGFGRLLRRHREELRKSQAQIAKAIGQKSQSFVAQIEKGRLVNISGELLANLAAAYKAPMEKLVAALIVDKYGVDPTRAKLLTTDVLDLDGVAAWEASLKAEYLWVVTPGFVDRSHQGIRDAVIHLLQRGTRVEFFVPANQCGEGGAFSTYRARLAVELGPESVACLRHYKLNKELRWMSSSFVIANAPSLFPASGSAAKPIAEGYTILLRDAENPIGTPEALAFRMSEEELWTRVQGIKHWLDDEAANRISAS